MKNILKSLKIKDNPKLGALEILKYIGPGFLVTVGFIDPGNWASNIAAGSLFSYPILWIVTLSTIMLIVLQHNSAHLGIATGLCLSEASSKFFNKAYSTFFLLTATLASISTALAEILGAAIGIKMLFNIPLEIGALITVAFSIGLLLTNSYKKVEKYIIAFVSLIGLSFIIELFLVKIDWNSAAIGWITPTFPSNSLPIIMSVLGAVVMPHNIFLHSEIIQSRQWNLENPEIIEKQLKYEFTDTLLAMIVGWAINSAMILIAASVFFNSGIDIKELEQAGATLTPLVGNIASIVFALALIFAGLSSSITAGMAGGTIIAGYFQESYDIEDKHSRLGVIITLLGGFLTLFALNNPFKGLIWSQIALSVQLPFTVFSLILLTSSKKVMGKYVNRNSTTIVLFAIGAIVAILNIALLIDYL